MKKVLSTVRMIPLFLAMTVYALFICWETPVHAGNIKNFQATMKESGFHYKNTLHDFLVYEKGGVSILMRSCNEYCCEGIVTAKPMSDEELAMNIMLLYAPFQNTLEWKGKEFVDASPSAMAGRTKALAKEILSNLEHSNRTEFAFDHLNVRAQCDPITKKDLQAGKSPILMIKLWIP